MVVMTSVFQLAIFWIPGAVCVDVAQQSDFSDNTFLAGFVLLMIAAFGMTTTIISLCILITSANASETNPNDVILDTLRLMTTRGMMGFYLKKRTKRETHTIHI